MMKKFTKNISARTFVTALLLYVLTGPFYVWPLLRIPHVSSVIGLVVALFFLEARRKNSKFDNIVVIVFLLAVLLFSLSIPIPVFGIAFVPLIFILLPNSYFGGKVYHYYEYIYIWLMLFALISWIFVLWGFLSPIGTIVPLVSLKDYVYYVYPFCVEAGYDSIRFCGPFDEPGVVGTFSAIMLCIRGFDFKSWKSIVLLVSGLFSLSFFFIIIVSLYGLFYSFKSKKFGTIFVLITVIGALYYFTKDEIAFYNTLWHRFEWNAEEQKFEGDTRMNYEADRYYEMKKGTMGYWFGLDAASKDTYNRLAAGGSSYKTIVMNNGMVFLMLYCGVFVMMAFHYLKTKRMDLLLYLFVFFSVVYQRTNIFDPTTMFLLYMMALKPNLCFDERVSNNILHSTKVPLTSKT